MTAPLPALIAAGFTPEEARKACNVIADWAATNGAVRPPFEPTREYAKGYRWAIDYFIARLHAAGDDQ